MLSLLSSSLLSSFLSTSSLLVLLLLLFFFSHHHPSFIEAANQCTPVAFRNGSKVSFFDLPNVNFPQLAQIGIGGGSFQFSYKPCDPEAHVPNAPKQCQGSFLSQTGCDVVFTEMEKPVVIFNEYVDIKYRSTSNGLNWTANIQLHCNPHVRDTIICPNNQYDATQTGGHKGPIFLTFQFESRAFCTDESRGGVPNPPPSPGDGDGDGFLGFKVTWGVVFLVIFFGPLFLYLLIMIPVNCADSNKSGAREICPHFEVWSALPGLALDGVTFLWSKLRGSHWQSCEDGSSNNYAGGGYTGREIVANNYGSAI